ncbi:2'-5' RNA ligase family protein [Dyella sp. 20L07]|uniref:2'-5' RNA ligase family protein n=1 Tax=Dyella sp. 20L07 TaxID=3384240 RepID=UPI003D2DC512
MLFSDPTSSPAETLVTELRDYPEWHRGRERYGVWVVPVDQPPLFSYIEHVRRQLADLLHPCSERQPHLTVFVCGFHQPARMENDDFTPELLRRQIAVLENAASVARTLPLAQPDSFASAAFIPVRDPEGQLAHWRAMLEGVSPEVRQAVYIPHITLGLYRRRVSAEVIRRRLSNIEPPTVPLVMNQLHYVTYLARSQLGALQSHYRLQLASSGEVIAASR